MPNIAFLFDTISLLGVPKGLGSKGSIIYHKSFVKTFSRLAISLNSKNVLIGFEACSK
jgi:hypothetical protein